MASASSRKNSLLQSLPRSGEGLDLIKIARLIVAALLFIVALSMDLTALFKTLILVLSALVVGYDLILELIDDVYDGDYTAPSVIFVLIAVLSFVIGYAWEGVLALFFYQLGLGLIELFKKRSRQSIHELLTGDDQELAEKTAVMMEDRHAADTELEKEISLAIRLPLLGILAVGVLFAVLMPLLTSLSVREAFHRALILFAIATPISVLTALPLAGLTGMSYATRFGVLFNNVATMEKLSRVSTAVVDKTGIFSADNQQFIGVKSDILDEKTMMEFVAHAVYYSDQAFAKAILAVEDREYRLDLISDFHDIPGCGVELKIGDSEVTLAKRELLAERGEAVPYDGKESGCVYYLMIAGRYVGKVLLTATTNTANDSLLSDLKNAGVDQCILLTDDSREESERLGQALNADEVYAEFSDETKLQYLESLNREDTMYLYANSLEKHSNAAVDIRVKKQAKYADATVTPESLSRFSQTLPMCRRVFEVAKENVLFAVLIKALLLFLGLTGHCTVWFAVFLDFAATLGTILNCIRVTQNALIDIPFLK